MGVMSYAIRASVSDTDSPKMLTQAEDEIFSDENVVKDNTEVIKKRQEEEAKKLAEEERKAKEAEELAKQTALKQRQLKARKKQEAALKKMDALRESGADALEYTMRPDSVEMVVELDPNNYGFRQRNHRMTLGGEFDLILHGRGMLQYDFRFFEYVSVGLQAGIDWSDLSIYNRFRNQLSKPAPKQFAILGGLTTKWRVTEWYMRSAFFLEPSLLFGYMQQSFLNQESNYWRLRPGLFLSSQTVFDSGFALNFRLGAEFPFDFSEANAPVKNNPVKEMVEPVVLVGFALAI